MAATVEHKIPARAEDIGVGGVPEKCVEIHEGELIIMSPAGRYHNWIAVNIVLMFREFCRDRPGITCGNDNEGFLLERSPDTLLSPDVCLFRKRPETEDTWMNFAPEVAVEIVSPSNTARELAWKRGKFFAHGCEQFWIVDPAAQSLTIHFADGRARTAAGTEVLAGEGIAEGLEIRLEEMFRRP